MSVQSVALGLLVYLLYAAPWCLVFARADKRWWVALLPVINLLVIIRIAARPWWWVLLLFVPLVGIGVWTVICLDVAERFGHGVPFTIGLVFLPFAFATWLGLGPDVYVRQPAAATVATVRAPAEDPVADEAPDVAEPDGTEPVTAEPVVTEPVTAEPETGTDQRIGAGE